MIITTNSRGVGSILYAARRSPLVQQVINLIVRTGLFEVSDYNATKSTTVLFGDRLALHRDHHFALLSWARMALKGTIPAGTTLVHLDLHPDLREPYNSFPLELINNKDAKSDPKFYEKVTRFLRDNDSYPDDLPEECLVIPALWMRLFDIFFHVIPGTTPCKDPTLNDDIQAAGKTSVLNAFYRQQQEHLARPWVLDLDLDFFSLPLDEKGRKLFPYDRAGNLTTDLALIGRMVKLFPPAFTTVAFSPGSSARSYVRYNTRTLEENAMIIAFLIETLGLSMEEGTTSAEPRRTIRNSYK